MKKPMRKYLMTNDINSSIYNDIITLRKEVFIEELGGSIDIEIFDEDKCHHLACYDKNICVATGRIIKLDDETAMLQRIAVKKSHRKLGIGRDLISTLESICKEKGIKKIKIMGRLSSIDFYHKIGYTKEGEIFYRDNKPHIMIEKNI